MANCWWLFIGEPDSWRDCRWRRAKRDLWKMSHLKSKVNLIELPITQANPQQHCSLIQTLLLCFPITLWFLWFQMSNLIGCHRQIFISRSLSVFINYSLRIPSRWRWIGIGLFRIYTLLFDWYGGGLGVWLWLWLRLHHRLSLARSSRDCNLETNRRTQKQFTFNEIKFQLNASPNSRETSLLAAAAEQWRLSQEESETESLYSAPFSIIFFKTISSVYSQIQLYKYFVISLVLTLFSRFFILFT